MLHILLKVLADANDPNSPAETKTDALLEGMKCIAQNASRDEIESALMGMLLLIAETTFEEERRKKTTERIIKLAQSQYQALELAYSEITARDLVKISFEDLQLIIEVLKLGRAIEDSAQERIRRSAESERDSATTQADG